jgi:hypothetical protein
MRTALLLLACTLPVQAQQQDIQKELIQRQQQSDAFNLQLRQSQEALKAPAAARPALESRQLSDRQRLENLSEQQRLDVRPDTPQSLRPYEREKLDAERRSLAVPPEVPVPPALPAQPIVQPPNGIRLEAPR